MSLACSDSNRRGLPGAQSDAAHASEQGLLQQDLVVTETVNGSSHSFMATLPPAVVVGTISQTLEASWNPNLLGIHQAPSYPQGWSIEYYAGSTRLAREPTTASEWAQVSRVVTTGTTLVEALDGERQALISTVSSLFTLPEVFFTFSGDSAGDGWDVFFDPTHTRVFNIHHHSEPATVMCRNLADASTCPGFPIELTQTSNLSTGRIDAVSNKLWQPTVTRLDARLAWDCVDLTTAARCATPVVLSQYTAASDHYDNHMHPVVIGRKMYSLGLASGGISRITCLNMATGTECAGVAMTQSSGLFHAGIATMENKIYVLPGLNQRLDCYDSTTWTRCAGSWPKEVSKGPVWTGPSADSLVNHVCASSQCFGLDGSTDTLPPNFTAYLAANPPEYSATSLGTKAAWNSRQQAYCWDMATHAKCADAFPLTVNQLYTTILDPASPDCLWTNSHDGIIRSWSTRTGTLGCTREVPHIRFKAETGIPRLGCDPASRVYQYKSFKLISPVPSHYTSAKMTVRDSSGVPIPGWINLPLSSLEATVNLTQLSPTVTGGMPTFDVAIDGLTNTDVEPSGTFRVTTGAPPQLCWDLPFSACPTWPGLALGNISSQETDVIAKGSFTTNSRTTFFTDQVLRTTVDISHNFDNCGTWLRATVVSLEDDSPVAGATVFLLDSTGSPILDSNLQPASAVSQADGTLEFPAWAAGYKLKLSRNARYTPVTAAVDAGGSGVTVASSGTLVSPTVTTMVNQTSHVTLTISADLDPPGAPVVTAPGAFVTTSTPIIRGIAERHGKVRVWLDDDETAAMTIAVDATGAWNFIPPTPLVFGTHSVSAIAMDAAGNPSAPTKHQFTFQRSHYGWGCTTATALPATWALLVLALSLGRRYPRRL